MPAKTTKAPRKTLTENKFELLAKTTDWLNAGILYQQIELRKMKTTNLIATLLIASALVTGCARKIHITQSQAGGMSQAAVDTLAKLRNFRLPLIKASGKMIVKVRGQFAQMEAGQLQENIKEFKPTITDTIIGGVTVHVIIPSTLKPENRDKIAYYIHGGGYVMGSATDQTGLIMAHELGLKTYSLDYTLAPEARFPIAMNQALTVYKYLVSLYDPNKIVGYSTSSGCGHMMGMLLKAKQENLPMINSVALLSPSLDVSGVGDSYVSNDGRDLLGLKNQGDKLYVAPFTGLKKGDPKLKDPLMSPVYGNYTSDFPAVVINTSTRDLFLSNSSRLYWKLKAAGVPVQLDVAEGMWHAFTVYKTIPEAVAARKSVIDFMFRSMASKNQHPIIAENNGETANITLVRTFVDEVINKENIDKVDELWAKDLKWHYSETTINGIDAYKQSLRASIGKAFKNMHLNIIDIIPHEDKVVLYFTNSGLNTGSFNGMPPANKPAKWYGMGIYRIENGKIAEAWFSEDILGMYQQLGFVK